MREFFFAGIVKLEYIRSSDQEADIFTKVLGGQQHFHLLRKLGVKDIIGSVSFRGSVKNTS